MARGPSLTALLGLLAVAGWQNRDKISDMLADARQSDLRTGDAATPQPTTGFSAVLADISRSFTGASAGRTLSSGLSELINDFAAAGKREQADSWVSTGRNKSVTEADIEEAIDAQTLDNLASRTGLSRADLVKRLSSSIPKAVDRFTPEGRIPSEDEGFRAI